MSKHKETLNVDSLFSRYLELAKLHHSKEYQYNFDFSCLGEDEKEYLWDLNELVSHFPVLLTGYYRLFRLVENLESSKGRKLGHNHDGECSCTCNTCFASMIDVYSEIEPISFMAEENMELHEEIARLDKWNDELLAKLEKYEDQPF